MAENESTTPSSDLGRHERMLDGHSDENRRSMNIQRLLIVLVAASMALIGLDVLVYLQIGVWQVLVLAGITAAALALVPVEYVLVRRRKLDTAGYLILLGTSAVAIGFELLVSGGTVYFAIAGTLTLALALFICWPGRPRLLVIGAGCYLTCLLLINLVEPLPRLFLTESPTLNLLIPVLFAALVMALLWVLVRAFRVGSIRTRLLISYGFMALLPVTMIGSVALIQGYATARGRAEVELELAAAMRESNINLWIEQLQNDLDTLSQTEETRLSRVGSLKETAPVQYQVVHDGLLERFQEMADESGRFSELFLLDRFGQVLVSTDLSQEGVGYNNEIFFQKGRQGPYVQPPFYTPAAEHRFITLVQPIHDVEGRVAGVLGARANLEVLNQIMSAPSNLGVTGETYLVGRNYRILTEPTGGEKLGRYVLTEGAEAAMETQTNGIALYSNYREKPVLGVYRWLPKLQVVLLAEQETAEAFRPVSSTLLVITGVALASILFAAVVALSSYRGIANPLADLAATVEEITSGNLALSARVDRDDEIGALARAFNSMTGQLRSLISSLEERVTERTRDLQQRSRYLEAAADVGNAASSILETDQLVHRVVELIRQRFDLYFVGLFLVDESGKWAELKAGTGQAGQSMLARGHRIRVGQGMVGWSIANARPRISLEVGEDTVRLATAELPDTQSEAAVPLRSRGRVVGALTVQDTQPEAFNQDTVAVFQAMADQVGVALDNARLFAQSQEALEAAHRAYGELTGEGWAELLLARPGIGFRSHAQGVTRIDGSLLTLREGMSEGAPDDQDGSEGEEDRQPLSLPISVRGNLIGVLETYRPGNGQGWKPEEVTLLEDVVDQLGAALDNARLYEDSQRKAARERLVRQITERLRTAMDVDAIAQTTAEELGKALGVKHSFVTLGPISGIETENGGT